MKMIEVMTDEQLDLIKQLRDEAGDFLVEHGDLNMQCWKKAYGFYMTLDGLVKNYESKWAD